MTFNLCFRHSTLLTLLQRCFRHSREGREAQESNSHRCCGCFANHMSQSVFAQHSSGASVNLELAVALMNNSHLRFEGLIYITMREAEKQTT